MELKEAFDTVVNAVNAKFKEGLFDINAANEIIKAISIVGGALSAQSETKVSEGDELPVMEEAPKKTSRSKK